MAQRRLQPYTEWELRDFSEGLIDKVDDNLLPENASRDCRNFISRVIGSMKPRPGQARLNETDLGAPVRGLHAYYYGANRRMIVATGDSVGYLDSENEFVELKDGLDTEAPNFFETCVNYMVSFNGVNNPWKWDGVTVSALEGAPGDGQFPVLHKEKLFVVPTSEPSTIRWSESFQPEQWEAVSYWDISKGDGDVITCLRKHWGELIIFKRRSLHVLRGTSLDDFRLDEMDSLNGCVGPYAAASMGTYLYFVSDNGLCVWNGMKVINLSIERIPKLWSTINKEHLHKAAVGVWDGLIWFSLPEGTSTENNLIVIYAPPQEGVMAGKFWPWAEINASCFQVFDDKFYSGDSVAGYVNQQDTGTDDFGLPINAYWEGKYFDQGSPEREKRARKLFVQDSPWSDSRVDVQVSQDYNPYDPLALMGILIPDIITHSSIELRAESSLLREYRFTSRARWRYISPKILYSGTTGCEVRGIMIPYKSARKPKVRRRSVEENE